MQIWTKLLDTYFQEVGRYVLTPQTLRGWKCFYTFVRLSNIILQTDKQTDKTRGGVEETTRWQASVDEGHRSDDTAEWNGRVQRCSGQSDPEIKWLWTTNTAHPAMLPNHSSLFCTGTCKLQWPSSTAHIGFRV